MNKKWIIVIIFLLIIFAFWQMGGIDYLAARTVFAPDHDSDLVDEEKPVIFSKDTEYEVEVIGEDLEIPWEILPLSESEFLVTERGGRVLLLNAGEIYTVYDVEPIGEGGLLGIEKSPPLDKKNDI